MTAYEKIKVEAYSGYRGEESPRTFFLADRRVEVVRILKQWVEETRESGERYRCFRVKGSDWREHVVCYGEVKKEWLYRKK